jgi:hypothetical protein
MRNIKLIAVALLFVSIIIGAFYFSWYLKRKVNYSFIYKSLVQETIKEMVKPEALK